MQALGPVRAEERISTLDVIRGFALLGILLMNIVGFGLANSYDDPTNSGGATGINLWVWITMHILAEGKMRCLFSMVFGAGVVLLTGRAEQRGAVNTADIFYRRNLWLMAAGVLHAFLLWQGEILYPYALCALALYPFRHMAAKHLIAIGVAMLVIIAGFNFASALEMKETITSGTAAIALQKSGAKLTEEQSDALKKWEDVRKHAKPTPEEVEKTNKRWRGGIVAGTGRPAGERDQGTDRRPRRADRDDRRRIAAERQAGRRSRHEIRWPGHGRAALGRAGAEALRGRLLRSRAA